MNHPSLNKKLLFITSNSIGDAVLSTGLLAHLVETHTDSRLTVVCGPAAADLFRAVPRLEKLIVLRKKSWKRHWLKFWARCIGSRWELIVDLRNSLFSYLLFSRRRVHRPAASGQHKVIDNAATLGLESSPPSPKIWLDAEAEANAARLLAPAGNQPILALAPAANWPAKQWPSDSFAELTLRLIGANGLLPNGFVLIAAAPHEREQIAPLLARIPPTQVLDVIGQDLLTVAACLKQCNLFIGNDSGLMHLSAAMGTPTLGLFGPGFETVYCPWGSHGRVVRTPESREELLRSKEPNLMKTLTVDAVATAATDFLLPPQNRAHQ